MSERFVWKVRYTLEVNSDDGDREEYPGYEATILCSDDILDLVRDLKSRWAGKTIRAEIDGEEFVSHVVGVKVHAAEVVATLTDFEDETT
jgi:hypothetical protein